MKSPLLLSLAAALFAVASQMAIAASASEDAADAADVQDTAAADQPLACGTIINGKPGLNNQGANSGNGGKGATIALDGKAFTGCLKAKGGNGGNNNTGKNSGNGGDGVSVE